MGDDELWSVVGQSGTYVSSAGINACETSLGIIQVTSLRTACNTPESYYATPKKLCITGIAFTKPAVLALILASATRRNERFAFQGYQQLMIAW